MINVIIRRVDVYTRIIVWAEGITKNIVVIAGIIDDYAIAIIKTNNIIWDGIFVWIMNYYSIIYIWANGVMWNGIITGKVDPYTIQPPSSLFHLRVHIIQRTHLGHPIMPPENNLAVIEHTPSSIESVRRDNIAAHTARTHPTRNKHTPRRTTPRSTVRLPHPSETTPSNDILHAPALRYTHEPQSSSVDLWPDESPE